MKQDDCVILSSKKNSPPAQYVVLSSDFNQLIKTFSSGSKHKSYLITGWDLAKNSLVAVKFANPKIRSKTITSTEQILQFERETKYYQALFHPNIVKFIDTLEVKISNTYSPGIVLEFLNKPFKNLSLEKICTLGIEIASALDYMHSSKFVHFDVKPSNIMHRRSSNQFVLVDLGSAANLNGDKYPYPNRRTQDYCDTLSLSSENASKADQFALALTLLELIDRKFYARGRRRKFFTDKLKTRLRLSPKVKPMSREVFKKATSPNRTDRFDTCTEFVSTLKRSIYSNT